MRQDTIVNTTLIAAPSSTKNNEGKLDPEMHQTKKANQWYNGMKVHIVVDKDSGLIHSVVTTTANVHDPIPAAELLHGGEEVVYADAGYQGIAKRLPVADSDCAVIDDRHGGEPSIRQQGRRAALRCHGPSPAPIERVTSLGVRWKTRPPLREWVNVSAVMRGQQERSGSLFSYVSIEERIPASHPLRRNRKLADQVRDRLNPLAWEGLKTLSVLGGMVGVDHAEWMIRNGLIRPRWLTISAGWPEADALLLHWPGAPEVGTFYWTVPAPDIVNPGREEQGSWSSNQDSLALAVMIHR
jgi:hypothetical protein